MAILLKHLLDSQTNENILDKMIELYPDSDLDGYRDVLEKLRGITDVVYDPELKICIDLIEKDDLFPEDEIEPWFDIHGWNDAEKQSYAIEFRPWKTWLSYEIQELTLMKYSSINIICHCLYEMTFISYNEEEVTECWNEISQMSEDIKNGTADLTDCISFEDLIKKLNENDEEDDDDPKHFD